MPELKVGENQGSSASAYERSVIGFRSHPSMQDFVKRNYLDEDLSEAVRRYLQSDEFSRICAILEPHLTLGSRLLDLGAGRGLTSFALAQKGASVTSVELDSSEVVGMGALARSKERRALPLAPVQCDILKLPFRDESFDVAFCRSMLHHLDDLTQGLREIWRVLRPGGLFLACNEHIVSPFSDCKRFLQAHPAVAYGVNEQAFPIWTYRWSLHRTGFHRIRFFEYEGNALQLSEFLASVKRRSSFRARLADLPLVGGAMGRGLYALHVIKRRYLRYLLVLEEELPAISFFGKKPSAEGSVELQPRNEMSG